MTIINCFSRCPEVIPTLDMTTEATFNTLVNGWISQFGCPITITIDQGQNFQSHLFRELTNMLSTNHTWIVLYHPMSKGLIECLHKHLKYSLLAHAYEI